MGMDVFLCNILVVNHKDTGNIPFPQLFPRGCIKIQAHPLFISNRKAKIEKGTKPRLSQARALTCHKNFVSL